MCRNCTLYKEAELPVVGFSKVRVCMSCILSHSGADQDNPQSPPAAPSRALEINNPKNKQPPSSKQWRVNSSSSSSSKSSTQEVTELNRESAMKMSNYNYKLDFSWEHPWPKPPVLPNEKERMAVLKSFEIMDTPAEDVFDIICDLASNALKCPIAAVSLIAEDRQWFKANVGLAQNEIPRNVSFCAHTIMSKEPLVIMDTTQDRRFKHNPLVTGAANIRFYAAAPICNKTGHILGTVFVFDTRPRDSCDVATLEKLSNVAMKNIEDRKNAEAAPVKKKLPRQQHQQQQHQQQSGAGAENQLAVAPASGEQQLSAGGPKMESMLMDLLCRTTETQQQLATQQGAMFQTLGSHTSQIDNLTNAVARMEAKLEASGALKRVEE